jgi:hypothetical protein
MDRLMPCQPFADQSTAITKLWALVPEAGGDFEFMNLAIHLNVDGLPILLEVLISICEANTDSKCWMLTST